VLRVAVKTQMIYVPTGCGDEILEYEEWNPYTFRDEITKVSVHCITYNHEKYIEDALKGFLMQETDFHFEVIVIDDASTDDTQSILKRYAEKYPDIFHLLLAKKNCYNHPKRQRIYMYLMDEFLKAPYIAYCEGDDYWTSKHKLQRQVDFLESHQDFSACVHNVRCVDGDGNLQHGNYGFYQIKEDYIYTVDNAYKYELAGQTASLMNKRNVCNWQELVKLFGEASPLNVNGDIWIQTNLAFHGKIYFMHEIMADHRRVFDGGDSYTAKMSGENIWWRSYSVQRDLKNMMDLQGFDVTRFSSNLKSYYQNAFRVYQENPTDENRLVLEQFEKEIQKNKDFKAEENKEDVNLKEYLLEQLNKTKKLVDKHLDIARLYDIWMSGKEKGRSVDMVLKERKYASVAIYGMGLLGIRLHNELKNTEVSIVYAIDQNKTRESGELHTYSLEELTMEDVAVPEVVVVTAFSRFEGIKKQLVKKGFKNILCIDELIYALLQD
jgi:glycosyltransferase involved in cell wall biosynthesis